MDTIEIDEAENTKQSEVTEVSEQTGISEVENPTEKSESQFSSFVSYHEGDSSSMDPSTEEMELSKSPERESTEKDESGANDQEDISSHDTDIIAYDTKESSSSSIKVSSTNQVTEIEEVAEDSESEPAIEVEVMELRKSGRSRKQTQLFGNPLLTPRFVPELLQHLPETMESPQEKYKGTVEFLIMLPPCTCVLMLYPLEI